MEPSRSDTGGFQDERANARRLPLQKSSTDGRAEPVR